MAGNQGHRTGQALAIHLGLQHRHQTLGPLRTQACGFGRRGGQRDASGACVNGWVAHARNPVVDV